VSESEIEIGN